MALDNTTLKTITAKLFRELDGAFIERPFALSYTEIALPYHSGSNTENKGRGTIILALNGENPFVVYSFDKFTKITDNSPFLNSLRKLAGTRVRNLKTAPGERVLTISIEVNDNNIDTTEEGYDLIIELFPMHPNAYLISYPTGKIVALFKEHGDIASRNYCGRGTKYSYPENRPELSADLSSIEEVRPFLARATFRHFENFSRRIGFKPALNELLAADRLYLIGEKLEPLSFAEPFAVEIAVENIYSHYVHDQRHRARILKEKDLIVTVDRALKIAEKKKANLDKDKAEAQKHLIYRKFGELLYMVQSEYVPGSVEMIVEGQRIALDPKSTLVENANRYFKKYRKARQAIVTLSELSLKTDDEIEYLQKKKLDIENGSPRDLQELREELTLTGYLKPHNLKNGRKKKAAKKTYEPHFLELGSARIGFGLNDLQNETLTFEIARRDSLFFHVKDHPGAHVVILSGQNSDETKTVAAELALFLSHLEDGEVLIAPRHLVKKNREKTGLVNILEYTTVTLRKIRDSSLALFKKALKED